MIPQIAPEAPTTGASGDQTSAPAAPASPDTTIEERVPAVAEVLLERGADDPEDEHVHPEMQQVPVEKGRGEQPPPLSLGDERPEQHAVLEDPVRRRAETRPQGELEHEHGDVDPDQGERHERSLARQRRARLARRPLRGTPLSRRCSRDQDSGSRPGRTSCSPGRSRVRIRCTKRTSPGRGGGSSEAARSPRLAYPCAGPRRAHTGRGRSRPDRDRHRRDPGDDDDLPGARLGIRAGVLHGRGRGGAGAPE